jgi:hypothetical protein
VQAISPQINVEANEIIADKSIAVVDQGVEEVKVGPSVDLEMYRSYRTQPV